MALVTFKDLCVDAVDEALMERFWAAAIGLETAIDSDGSSHLTGPTPQHTIWVNAVPEPKTVKNRIHLDVWGTVADNESLGARVLLDWETFAWTVMVDPEGNEFCVFEVQNVPACRLKDLVVDAENPTAQSAWWADVFGAEVVHDDGYSYVTGIDGAPFEDIDFVPVPEPKTVKNRIHWDVKLGAGILLEDLIAKGASRLRAQDDEIGWSVMADPEGNEFCVFAAD